MWLRTTRQRWRATGQRVRQLLHTPYWFPHVPLALLLGLGALALLRLDLGVDWQHYLVRLVAGQFNLKPSVLPPLLIGLGLLAMAVGLLLRSRLAWTMALLLAITALVNLLADTRHAQALFAYFVLLLGALLGAWRHFDRSSVAASTLFALTSVALLLIYATFGSYYLGADFRPAITDLATALYYAMVTMSTVGYGDIVPVTPDAKLFAVSVIVLGVAVFATSLTAVIAPMVSRSLQRIVNRKGSGMKREGHFVVIGNSSLAINTWRELARRGQPVRVCSARRWPTANWPVWTWWWAIPATSTCCARPGRTRPKPCWRCWSTTPKTPSWCSRSRSSPAAHAPSSR